MWYNGVMERMGVIYGLCDSRDPSKSVRYVGQTVVRPEKRLIQHRYDARRPDCPLAVHRWGRSIGPENMEMLLLETGVPSDELDARETHWIAELKTFRDWGHGGLNLTSDGKGTEITNPSRESRKAKGRESARKRSEGILLRARPGSTPEEVISEMRTLYSTGTWTLRDLENEFQVDKQRVRRIVFNEEAPDPQYIPPTETVRVSRKGNRNYGGKSTSPLTWELVDQLRAEWLTCQESGPEIAQRYGTSHDNVMRIVHNRAWYTPEYTNTRGRRLSEGSRRKSSESHKGIPKPPGFGKRGETNVRSKLTNADVEDILSRLHRGETGVSIAKIYNVDQSNISCIRRGLTWTDVPRPWNVVK